MTANRNIDLTPSGIATKLLPDGASAADRAIVEAMAECALSVVHEVGTEARTMAQIEFAMVSAARCVLKQHRVRVDRLFKAIFEDDNEVDSTERCPRCGAVDDCPDPTCGDEPIDPNAWKPRKFA